ncbi:efflux RND transporter permease subunit [Roseovarius sp. CAU 1744]|uniref:efflux RND transporter permease subunit n=1 Tax=Roseovarius sp. CAU 1744 TaxID=3140368 RepID=UPI00325A97FA
MNKTDTGGLAGLSVRRPLLATVMNLLIVIAGIAALFGVEVRELPDIDRPVVSVRAIYPGASPTTVDAEVTSLVESAVARVAGVQAVRSSSEEGNFRLHVEFRPDRDLAEAANDVREAVSRVVPRLPAGVEDLFVVKAEQDARPIMQVAVWSESDPIDVLTRRVNDEIAPELTAVDGVAEIAAFGDRDRVIRVEVKPERLAAFGLSIGEVVRVLSDAQFDVPVGSFEAGQLEVLVRADATVAEPARIQELIIRDPVRLGDLADVYFGLATPESFARLNERLVLNLGIVRQAQSNTVRISDQVQAAIQRLEQRFPDLRFEVTSDDAVFIRGAIREVLITLGLALTIVVGVIWLFLGRLGATMIPAVTIPVALVGSVAAIWLLGFSINLITLLALVLATGLVVDDAIVVTENIQRRRADGMGPKAAAVIGARQVFFAVIATTITLIAVFVPLSFLPSDAGRLFGEFGFVLAITVALSSFVALSVCPMIASQLGSLGATGGVTGWLGGRFLRLYETLLRPLLAAPLITLTCVSIVAGSSLLVYDRLGEELVPAEDRGMVTVRMQGPDGTGLDFTDRQVETVEAMFRPWVERGIAEGLYSITGRYDLNRGQVGARLIPWDDRDVGQAVIEADLRPKLALLAGAQARVQSDNSLNLRRGSDGGITIALTGATYPSIAEAADEFARRMEELPGLSGIRVQYQATQPQLSITIDRSRAADLNVPMSELSSTLRALIDEDEIGEITIGDQAVPIILQSAAGAVRDPSDLLNLYVRAETGNLVPLVQLVSFSEEGVAAELDRHGQRRAVEIDASVAAELTLRGAVDRIRALAEETLPEGIGLLLLGEAAALDETSNALAVTYVIALVVVFLVLVAQFESVTSAAVVMVTVPFGVCAAIYALWLTGTTINIYSQIGVLMLIGIMAKNGILLVEFADQLRDRGADVADAAFEAARTRLRPIAMTLASTVLAGLPLILGSGPGAEARASIGWVVFGGLGLAAIFTLFLTPVAYALVAGLSRSRATAEKQLEAEIAAAEI